MPLELKDVKIDNKPPLKTEEVVLENRGLRADTIDPFDVFEIAKIHETLEEAYEHPDSLKPDSLDPDSVNFKLQQIDSTQLDSILEIKNRVSKLFEEVLLNYPELKNVKIVFSNQTRHMMETRPNIKKLFGKKKNREYRVYFSLNMAYRPLFNSLTDEEIQGWFAHELGHALDYEKRSSLGMISFGVKYLFSEKFKRKAEMRAEENAIKHGFACESIECSEKIERYLTPEKKSKRHKTRLSTEELHKLEIENQK